MINAINTLGAKASAAVGSVMFARTQGAAKIRAAAVFTLTGMIFTVSSMGVAEATDLNAYARTVSGKTNSVVDIVTYLSYIGGAILSALGIVDLKKHVENPSQTPMKNGLAKLGFGGMLLALPFLAGVVQGTVKDGSQVQYQNWSSKPTVR